ncbi:polysaccharide deacetylase family protein [Paenibacillus silvisoli]|uniref:hypothetical protein n=1 Tax=Paenibacillus silvisoli TaxID=3110539 RepID=UPI002805D8A6|nr:hypothetical protein [Paenibacillus silvisoli]
MQMARVGVLLDRQSAERRWKAEINVFDGYIVELLSAFRIPCTMMEDIDELDGNNLDILIAGHTEHSRPLMTKLLDFVREGGVLLSYGGLNPLAGQLGFRCAAKLSFGYAKLGESDADELPLRFASATPWAQADPSAGSGQSAVPSGQLSAGSPEGPQSGPAAWTIPLGSGFIERWAIDIAQSIVTFQQGTGPVWEDGIPAGDGTGEVNEGILKADDAIAMNWQYDRQHTAGAGVPFFAYPYADLWKGHVVGQLLRWSLTLGKTLPFAGFWPIGVSSIATISHDSDVNDDIHAGSTLDLLAECGIRTTWCMLEPGYGADVYERVKLDGHELAFHYNALDEDGGKWGREEFLRQQEWLKSAAHLDRITTNKNHYTRFEGWGELFEWCEQAGISADQTRGPSKRGNVGFLFGTCHPYFPMASFSDRNRLYDVLEIGFLTQDVGHPQVADPSVIEPFLDRVATVRGVAHFLFHQIHIHERETVRDALRTVVNEAKRKGFAFWTSRQIDDWVRSRRSVSVAGVDAAGVPILRHSPERSQTAGEMEWFIPVLNDPAGSDRERASLVSMFGVSCLRWTRQP